MEFNSIDKIKATLKPIVKAWLIGNETPRMMNQAQEIYKFITYDRSELFPDNESEDWDADSYGGMMTCDTCYETIMNFLNNYVNSN